MISVLYYALISLNKSYNEFCLHPKGLAAEIANMAVDPSELFRQNREKIARYLEKFAHYFSFTTLPSKIIDYISREDELNHAANEFIVRQGLLPTNEQNNDPFRNYVYNIERGYTHHPEHVKIFLQRLNILKDDDHEILSKS